MKSVVIIILLSLAMGSHGVMNNDQPVIGIMNLPSEYEEYPSNQYAYMAASYVKFIESSGARVVPIPFEATNSTLEKIFTSINGILITGGGIEIDGPTKFT
jgi:gamma-glutamyl hydrolase